MQISEISRQGDGIARIQGFVIFVKEGKVGQKTKIRVTKVGDRFASAEVVTGGGDQAQNTQQDTPAASNDSPSKDSSN